MLSTSIVTSPSLVPTTQEIKSSSISNPSSRLSIQKDTQFLVPLDFEQPITNYSIVAMLQPTHHRINALTTIEYANHADESLITLVFHLYPNAFYPNGYITMNAVNFDGSNLSYTFGGPDQTLLVIDLLAGSGPGPLAPDATITLELSYSVTVPNAADRFGWWYTDDPRELLAYNLGNWHPIIAVYDGRGWHNKPYTFMGEGFYSDVALYDVYLTVPEDYIIAATGELQDITIGMGTRTWHWSTGPVRDFTWCASPNYETASILVDGVNVTSYHTSYREAGGLKTLEVATDCLTIFGSLFGPYPWESLSFVETDFWAGGMEYPQLIMIGSGLYDDYDGLSSLAAVTAHEIGHEWIPFTIGTDSYAEPWIDEGFASYCELVYVEYVYGIEERASYRESDVNRYWNYIDQEGDKCINQSMEFWEGLSWYDYGAMVYSKAALIYDLLRTQIGNSTFYDAWQYIYTQAIHRNIRANTLQQLFEDYLGESLDWFFSQWVFGQGALLLAVDSAIKTQTITGWSLTFRIHQSSTEFVKLRIPVFIQMQGHGELVWVWLEESDSTQILLSLLHEPLSVNLDPDEILLCRYPVKMANVNFSLESPLYLAVLIGGSIGVVILFIGIGYLIIRRSRITQE
jgi:hypothetical protein